MQFSTATIFSTGTKVLFCLSNAVVTEHKDKDNKKEHHKSVLHYQNNTWALKETIEEIIYNTFKVENEKSNSRS